MKIHILIGGSGEYSDHNEWIVGAFINIKSAKNYMKLCTDVVKELEKKHDGNWHRIREDSSPFDPQFSYDYTGVDYSIQQTELIIP